MSTVLSQNERYTFGRISGQSVILDSTDNVQAVKEFKSGIIASGSGGNPPILVQPHASGHGIRIMGITNDIAAELRAVGNQSDSNNVNSGELILRDNGTEKVALNANPSHSVAHFRTEQNSSEDDLLLMENGNNMDIGKFRADGKVFFDGGDFKVRAGTGSNASTANYLRMHVIDDAGFFDFKHDGDFHMRQNTTTRVEFDGSVLFTNHIRPSTDDERDLGSSDNRWDDVFATNGTINTSDKNLKTNISSSDLGLDFINNLKPIKYKWINNNSNRFHYGLVAQEVSESLASSSIHTDQFAGYIRNDIYSITKTKPHPTEESPNNTIQVERRYSTREIEKAGLDINDFTYVSSSLSLRYTEFISPLIKAVQELSAEVETLKARISALEG